MRNYLYITYSGPPPFRRCLETYNYSFRQDDREDAFQYEMWTENKERCQNFNHVISCGIPISDLVELFVRDANTHFNRLFEYSPSLNSFLNAWGRLR